LKYEAESDIGQRRKKIVEFASIPLGATLVSSSARLDTKGARILSLPERRREMTNELWYLATQRLPHAARFSP
jgi:hypothetical protein